MPASAKPFRSTCAILSRDRWSLLPSIRRLIAECGLDEFGTLDVYAIAAATRKTSRSSIASSAATSPSTPRPEKLAERGRFYSEDELVRIMTS